MNNDQFIILLLTILSAMFANIGLLLWFSSQARSDWQHCDSLIQAIHAEIKDFHGRLEKIDAEYKSHMMFYHSNHENNKGK